MPAVNVWTGSAGPDFDTPGSWTLGHVAAAGEDLVFGVAEDNGPGPLGFSSMTSPDGEGGGVGGTGADCYGMHPPAGGGAYNSVTLEAVYVGKVTVTGGFSTGDLNLAGGTLDQGTPGASYADTDITVTGIVTLDTENHHLLAALPANFTWTNGTLNSTDHAATLTLDGATGDLSPAVAGTLINGDNLNLLNAASLTVNPGTLQFNNGTGVTLGENTSMFINAQAPAGQQANVNFNGDGKPWTETDKEITLNTGATLTVKGPGVWNDSKHAIYNRGGIVDIKGNATVSLTAPHTEVQYRQYTGSTTQLHSGSTLAANNLAIFSGTFNIVADSQQGETAPAKVLLPVDGEFSVGSETGNATITFSTPAQGWWPPGTELYWTFQVTGNVLWNSNSFFAPRVDCAVGGIADIMQIDGKLMIDQGKVFTIASQPKNVPPAGLPVDFERTIVKTGKGIQVQQPVQQIVSQGTSPKFKPTLYTPPAQPDASYIKLVPGS